MSTGYWIILILTAPLWLFLSLAIVAGVLGTIVFLWAPVFDAIGFLVKKIRYANSSSSGRDQEGT